MTKSTNASRTVDVSCFLLRSRAIKRPERSRREEANFLKSTAKKGCEATPRVSTLRPSRSRPLLCLALAFSRFDRARKLLEEPRLPARISRPPTRYQPPSAPSSTPRHARTSHKAHARTCPLTHMHARAPSCWFLDLRGSDYFQNLDAIDKVSLEEIRSFQRFQLGKIPLIAEIRAEYKMLIQRWQLNENWQSFPSFSLSQSDLTRDFD